MAEAINLNEGKSAYEIWLAQGNTGTEADFLASLQGNSGYQGAAGELEVKNNLTEGGATAALSAEMGKQLNNTKADKDLENLSPAGQAKFDAKANKAGNATGGNLAGFDDDGNLMDTGIAKEKVAQNDGYYETMTVGSANNLVGKTTDTEQYLIRPTGGQNNEVADGVAILIGLKGESVSWNQLVGQDTTNVPTKTGNLYYCVIDGERGIVTGDGTPIAVTGGADMVMNITAMGFGVGATTAGVERWLARNVGMRPYYAYNQGALLPAKTVGIRTWGRNIIDTRPTVDGVDNPDYRKARCVPYTWIEEGVDRSNLYTVKNLPAGATMSYIPDRTGVPVELVADTEGHIDIASYGSGVLELSAVTVDTYVCMTWNGKMDAEAVPFAVYETSLDMTRIKGKVDGAGEYVTCFADGMKNIGTIFDEIKDGKAVKRVGGVDIGTRAFAYTNSSSVFRFSAPGCRRYGSTTRVEAIVGSAIYTIQTRGSSSNDMADFAIQINNAYTQAGYCYIKNTSETLQTIANAMRGIWLYYELEEYITYTDLVYEVADGVYVPLDEVMGFRCDNWSMEEQRVAPYADGSPTSVAATMVAVYPMDAVEAIDTLEKTTLTVQEFHDNMAALLAVVNENCSAILGGTFAVSDTSTDKVFGFTFTANTTLQSMEG